MSCPCDTEMSDDDLGVEGGKWRTKLGWAGVGVPNRARLSTAVTSVSLQVKERELEGLY